MNRFIIARDYLNNKDELIWFKKRPNGEYWKCLWRRGRNWVSFVAVNLCSEKNQVKKAFTIQLIKK